MMKDNTGRLDVAMVAHLIGQARRGGAERQLFHIAKALHERGWPQAVISFDVGGAWRDQWNEAGIPLFEIPRSPIKLWRLWRLSCLFRRLRPSIIQTWSPHLAAYAQWTWTKGNARIIFGVLEDLTIDRATGEPEKKALKLPGLATSDYAIGNSQRNFEKLERCGVRLPPHEVIRNQVVPRGNAKPGETVPTPRMVGIGSLRRLKAYDVLLQALGRLAAEGRSFELLLAGDGQDRQELEDLSSELNLTDRVQFLGEVDDVWSLLDSAHILVHPSRSEGLCNTILEGMADGLPIVGTWETASEIVENEREGLLVPAGSPDALAEAIGRLLGDPPLRERLGKAALERVQREFNADAITQQYERAYHSLLA